MSDLDVYTGIGQEDLYDPDEFEQNYSTAGTAAASLIGPSGSAAPLATPNNYVQKLTQLNLYNAATAAIKATIQMTNGTITVVLLEVSIAASSSVIFDVTRFKLVAPPGYYFQALSSAAASLDVQARARFVRGAG